MEALVLYELCGLRFFRKLALYVFYFFAVGDERSDALFIQFAVNNNQGQNNKRGQRTNVAILGKIVL
jgi:hypothetical protein